MAGTPPPDVAAAAAKVQAWLDADRTAPVRSGDPAGRVSDEQFAKMTPAQRLDYTRQFDQSQFVAPDPGRR